jgi:FixJ family two-component response regulator
MAKSTNQWGTPSAARAAFRRAYSQQTFSIVRMIAEGFNTSHISTTLNVTSRTVGTTRANVSRGVYKTYLSACGFTPRFSQSTQDAVAALRSGTAPADIVSSTSLSQPSVAAIVGNFNRGVYDTMA